MKKLFIYNPLFRLLSPIFSGAVVYLLILLIYNNVEQVQDQFLGQELYLCIGLSYVIQEVSIFLLYLFNKAKFIKTGFLVTLLQVLVFLSICVAVVTISMYGYYHYVEGYSPNFEELWIFNAVFCIMATVYMIMYSSHQYLHKINTKKLESEVLAKENTERDFQQFTRGINPNLLFESLESLLVLIHKDQQKSDDFIDHLASIYRYILTNRDKELIEVQEEFESLSALAVLFNALPYRKFSITNQLSSNFLIIPSSLLYTVEQIIRGSIKSSNEPLEIKLIEDEENFKIEYQRTDRILNPFSLEQLEEIIKVYKIYSLENISIETIDGLRTIRFPKLKTQAQL